MNKLSNMLMGMNPNNTVNQAQQDYGDGKINLLSLLAFGGIPGAGALSRFFTENDPRPVASPVAPVESENLPPLPQYAQNFTLNTPNQQNIPLNVPLQYHANKPDEEDDVILNKPLEYKLNPLTKFIVK